MENNVIPPLGVRGPGHRVLIIGWDAADWKIITPLMDAGLMPTLNKLVNDGVMGNIATLDPLLSPMLWSSIATGKRAYQHGILNFTEPDPKNNFIKPVNVTSRKVKALWNILSQKNFKSHVVGWWPSHPAEPINGISVSNFYQRSYSDEKGEMKLVPGCIYPKEFESVFAELVVEPKEITPALILPFIPKANKIDQKKDNALQALARIMSDATCVHAAATWIMENQDWDFMAVYYDAIDHFCHRFMRYHPPRQEHVCEEQYEIYKNVVSSAYRFHDMMLERLLELAGDDTTVILLSDHGFHSDHLRPKFLPKEPAAPAYEHRHHGIVVMRGAGIKKDERIYGTTLLDITPTVLQLFNLPVGKDMEGRVIQTAFTEPQQTDFIDSWETVEGNSGMHIKEHEVDPWAEQIAMNQLIELGYVENPGEDKQKAIKVCVDESQFNLARAYMDGNKFTEAYSMLQLLCTENKEVVRFALTFMNCCTHLGKHDEAQQQLDALKENKNAGYLNFNLLQGNLFFAQGKIRKALTAYETSLQKQSQNHVLNFSVGKCYLRMNRLADAESYFLRALSIDENNATYYHALSQCYFKMQRYEECIAVCINTIGLLFYFPNAHYLMGESLFQLKQFSEAAQALELFLTMVPDHVKARERLASLNPSEGGTFKQPTNTSVSKEEQQPFVYERAAYHKKYLEEHSGEVIYIVSGLPRSGTSMMMNMLHEGGMNLLVDEIRKADKNNERGYYEYEPVKRTATDATWLQHAKGKVVKVIAQQLLLLPHRYKYKVVFMQRDLNEIIHSQQVMLGKAEHGKPANYPLALATAFKNTLAKIEKLKSEPHVELIYISYNELLQNPEEALDALNQFFDEQLNIEKMQAVIDKASYRSKL